jgi:hypothetical protein
MGTPQELIRKRSNGAHFGSALSPPTG